MRSGRNRPRPRVRAGHSGHSIPRTAPAARRRRSAQTQGPPLAFRPPAPRPGRTPEARRLTVPARRCAHGPHRQFSAVLSRYRPRPSTGRRPERPAEHRPRPHSTLVSSTGAMVHRGRSAHASRRLHRVVSPAIEGRASRNDEAPSGGAFGLLSGLWWIRWKRPLAETEGFEPSMQVFARILP